MNIYKTHGVEFSENQAVVIRQGKNEEITEQDLDDASEILADFGLDPFSEQFKELPRGFDGFYRVVDKATGQEISKKYPGSSALIVEFPGSYGVELIESSIETVIPAELWAKYSHLSYAEMAEVQELEPWADELLQAEADWFEADNDE
jgi:hypothetical protein